VCVVHAGLPRCPASCRKPLQPPRASDSQPTGIGQQLSRARPAILARLALRVAASDTSGVLRVRPRAHHTHTHAHAHAHTLIPSQHTQHTRAPPLRRWASPTCSALTSWTRRRAQQSSGERGAGGGGGGARVCVRARVWPVHAHAPRADSGAWRAHDDRRTLTSPCRTTTYKHTSTHWRTTPHQRSHPPPPNKRAGDAPLPTRPPPQRAPQVPGAAVCAGGAGRPGAAHASHRAAAVAAARRPHVRPRAARGRRGRGLRRGGGAARGDGVC
jgi:hypothetical protein